MSPAFFLSRAGVCEGLNYQLAEGARGEAMRQALWEIEFYTLLWGWLFRKRWMMGGDLTLTQGLLIVRSLGLNSWMSRT